MATIEERVVSMKFQGEQFLAGIDKSLAKLEQLNAKLKMAEGAKGLSNIGAAAQQQSGALSKMAEGVQHISDRFKTMGIVGMTAISNITSQAMFAGQRLVKSLTLDPILQGFREYELNMNSIQTILGNTQAAGTTLKDVTKTLDELNHYADQTIYSFSEMAKNIGTFTAAGVGLKPASAAIKGIANLAALSGSNSQQASTAMYQLSQAISAGTVSLEDWNSVVNAGMGGTVFQRALAQTAVTMGVLDKNAVKLTGDMKNVTVGGESFRKSISAAGGKTSWLTSDVLTKTLAQFTGDLKDAELAAMGFDKAQIKAIQAQAKTAKAAATEVKTLSGLMGNLKESAGSGWAQTWKTIFGDFPEAKTLFTDVKNVLGGFLDASANTRNTLLKDWKELGGRTVMIDAIGNAFKALVSVIKPLAQGFRDVFPRKTAQDLYDFSVRLRDFTKNLSLSGETAKNLRRTFAGVFAIFGIGLDVIKEVVKTLFRLVGVTFDGSGGFLEFTARIGDFLVNLREAINKGEGLTNFFKGLGDILALPIKALHIVGDALASVFKDVDGTKVTQAVGEAAEKLEPLGRLGEVFAGVWGRITGILDSVLTKMRELGTWAANFFGEFGSGVVEMMSKLDFNDVLAGLNTGFFATLLLMLRNIIGGGGLGGIMENLSDSVENLAGALGAMQNTLRAATLLQIAAAVLMLAVAMDKMAKIDAAGLTRAGAAITVMFTQLMGALLIFEKISSFTGFAKMPFVALSMILLAAAVNVLASAMQKIALLDWEGVGKGLVGVTVLLAGIVAAMRFMPKPQGLLLASAGMVVMAFAISKLVDSVAEMSQLDWQEMARGLVGVGALIAALAVFASTTSINVKGFISGVVILLLASAIKTLAKAVKDMAAVSWDEMIRGLTGTAAALALISGALKFLPPSTLLSAAAIFIVASSLAMIVDALSNMGGMSWEEIGRGLTVLASSLGVMAVALNAMTTTLPGAAALIIASAALGMLTTAVRSMADLSWGEIARSMVTLAASLLILAGGLYLMSGALPGAAALIVAAGALAILAPVLTTLGGMSWESIAKGLAALAGVFVVLGVAGLLLTPVVPTLMALAGTLLALGAAMLVAGVGVLAFGAGITLLAAGLAALAVSGVAGTTALVGMLAVILGAVPMIVKIIGQLLVALLDLIIKVAPKLFQAAVVLIEQIVKALVRVAPRIVDGMYKILTLMLESATKYVPRMVDAGQRLVVGILNGIARNIGKVITAATNVIVAFLNGIAANAGRVTNAGVKVIISFVNGMASSIRSNSGQMRAAGLNLAMAIIDGMTGGLASGIGRVASMARQVASSALNAAKSVLGIASPSKEFEKIGRFVNEGFRKGLDGNKGQVDSAFKSLRDQLTAGYKSATADVMALEKRLRKLRSARKKDHAEIRETTRALAQARLERARTSGTLVFINKHYKDEQATLGRLATVYDVVTAKLKTANETYANAVKTRDDYNKSIRDQYADAIAPTGEMKATEYVDSLKKQVEDTKSFVNQIQQLRKMGLNDETYKDLLSAGTSALPFVTDLLKGGKNQINQVNSLNKELDRLGVSMGKSASTSLYQAAVNSAAGLVKGLKNQQAAIERQMDVIANAMVKAIKKRLGIKSPSRVFAEIGKYTSEGLSMGLQKNESLVVDSATSVGDKAVEAMRVSLSHLDKMAVGNMNIQPTIRPVLDLTDVRKNAGKLSGLLPTNAKMRVDASYGKASVVAAAVRDRSDGGSGDGSSSPGAMLSYTQIIQSPKAVSAVEVYRGTKNQLSTVKGALST